MNNALYPMLLTPTLHIKVWGGRKLDTSMGKYLPGDAPYGESWELHDTSTVANGQYAGYELTKLIHKFGADLIGEGFDPSEGFPLLVKLLDATEWLSVQVHPNDQQARELEGDPRGKTEAWIMLETDPEARLVIGVQPGTSRETMAQAIRQGTLEELLVFAEVEQGDVLYMPANTVHAVGPGILLYEVQQSSNVTYRLYDWNRMGLDGKPRELHIEKGVQISNLSALPEVTHPEGELVVDGDYFQTRRFVLDDEVLALNTNGRFHSLTCIDGIVTVQHPLETFDVQKGQTALMPAALGDYELAGTALVLCSYLV
jgi:mannose-6-phosphate isomerase